MDCVKNIEDEKTNITDHIDELDSPLDNESKIHKTISENIDCDTKHKLKDYINEKKEN